MDILNLVCAAAPEKAVEREGQVNSVEVFNPSPTTLGISVSYHL